MNDGSHLDFHPSRGGRQARDLHKRAGGAPFAEGLAMRAGNMTGIRHVDDIDDGSYDVAQFRARFAKRRRDDRDRSYHLAVGITIEVRGAGRRPGDEYLVADAHRARVAIFVLEGIAG